MANIDREAEQAAELLLNSSYCVVLTGAGVSTESGIPDFRSPDSGLWNKVNPELFTIQGFKADPAQFYSLGREFFYTINNARPNDAHKVLGQLQQKGLIKTIITQNVDGLHQKGGASNVLEIHGTMGTASCIYCGLQVAIDDLVREVEEGLIPPLCPECGEPVKPDVILFGEAMPPAYKEALEEVSKADFIMVIGSSMQVSPANMLPELCDNIVIINHSRTFYDDKARVAIHSSTSEAMTKILQVVEAH